MSTQPTTKVLKASDVRGLHSQIAFNFEDIRQRCDEHVARVQAQARQILEDAHSEAEALRKSTYAEAYAAAHRQALRDAEAEIERRAQAHAETKAAETLSSLIPALEAAASALVREQDVRLAHWEETSLRLCVAIAEKLIRREIETQPQIAVDMISHALKLASGSPALLVALHPDDVELLGENAERVISAMSACGSVSILTDDLLDRGSCRVESDYGIVDATLDTMLNRIVDELLEHPHGGER